jgi:hypothetical protein
VSIFWGLDQLAYEKLAISYEKQNKIQDAIEICDKLISHTNIPCKSSYLTKADFIKRRKKLLSKLDKLK